MLISTVGSGIKAHNARGVCMKNVVKVLLCGFVLISCRLWATTEQVDAIYRAARDNDPHLAQVILENGGINVLTDRGDSVLFLAIADMEGGLEDNVATVYRLLDQRPDVNLVFPDGFTAVTYAWMRAIELAQDLDRADDAARYLALARRLSDLGGNVNVSGERCPLVHAVNFKNFAIVRELIEQRRANPNYRWGGDHPESVVNSAIVSLRDAPEDQKENAYEIVRFLARQGGDLATPVVPDGQTSLMKFIEELGPVLALRLVNDGFDLGFDRVFAGQTALMMIIDRAWGLLTPINREFPVQGSENAQKLQHCFQLIEALIARTHNVDQSDARQGTALQMLVSGFPVQKEQVQRLIRALIERGASVDAQIDGGPTVLMRAIFRNMPFDIVMNMIEHSQNLMLTDGYGDTALMALLGVDFYTNQQRLELARVLIGREGQLATQAERNGQTPLMLASRKGGDVVALLLENGADAQINTVAEGGTALTTAIDNGNFDTIRTLVGWGAGLEESAAHYGDRSLVDVLQERIGNLQRDLGFLPPENGERAAYERDIENVGRIRDFFANPEAIAAAREAVQREREHHRPLTAPEAILQAANESEDALRSAIEVYGSVDTHAEDGYTALMRAAFDARETDLAVFGRLLTAGANPNSELDSHETPFGEIVRQTARNFRDIRQFASDAEIVAESTRDYERYNAIAELMMAHRGDINMLIDGKPLWINIARNEFFEPPVVEMLVEHFHANIAAVDAHDSNALNLAMEDIVQNIGDDELPADTRQLRFDILMSGARYLAEHLPDVDHRSRGYDDQPGDTALYTVLDNPQVQQLIRMLLDHGASVDAFGGRGENRFTVLQELLVKGMPIALIGECIGRSHDVNITSVDAHGLTALVAVFVNALIDERRLHQYTPEERVQLLRMLIRAGANVNPATAGVMPVLIGVVFVNDIDAARVLLEAGADVNARIPEGFFGDHLPAGSTVLTFAAMAGRDAMVHLFVEWGASADAVEGTLAAVRHEIDTFETRRHGAEDPSRAELQAIVDYLANPTAVEASRVAGRAAIAAAVAARTPIPTPVVSGSVLIPAPLASTSTTSVPGSVPLSTAGTLPGSTASAPSVPGISATTVTPPVVAPRPGAAAATGTVVPAGVPSAVKKAAAAKVVAKKVVTLANVTVDLKKQDKLVKQLGVQLKKDDTSLKKLAAQIKKLTAQKAVQQKMLKGRNIKPAQKKKIQAAVNKLAKQIDQLQRQLKKQQATLKTKKQQLLKAGAEKNRLTKQKAMLEKLAKAAKKKAVAKKK